MPQAPKDELKDMPREIFVIREDKRVRGEHEVGYWDIIDDGSAKYIRADLVTPALTAEAVGKVREIRERWTDRTWPKIGYFTHGQAVQDILDLLTLLTASEKEKL